MRSLRISNHKLEIEAIEKKMFLPELARGNLLISLLHAKLGEYLLTPN